MFFGGEEFFVLKGLFQKAFLELFVLRVEFVHGGVHVIVVESSSFVSLFFNGDVACQGVPAVNLVELFGHADIFLLEIWFILEGRFILLQRSELGGDAFERCGDLVLVLLGLVPLEGDLLLLVVESTQQDGDQLLVLNVLHFELIEFPEELFNVVLISFHFVGSVDFIELRALLLEVEELLRFDVLLLVPLQRKVREGADYLCSPPLHLLLQVQLLDDRKGLALQRPHLKSVHHRHHEHRHDYHAEHRH